MWFDCLTYDIRYSNLYKNETRNKLFVKINIFLKWKFISSRYDYDNIIL